MPSSQTRPARFVAPARVDVLHPVDRFFHRAAAHVEADLRLRANQLREAQKLIGPELVVFRLAPGHVQHAHALVHRADAVAPVVAGDEVPAKAQQRHFERLGHRDRFGIQSVHVVGGIEQRLIDQHAGVAAHGHREIRRLARGKLSVRKFQ